MPTKKYFKKVKTAFCFLDETGLIYSKRDKFFAIGIIKCNSPEKLYNQFRKVRQKYNYKEELKWSSLNRKIRFDVARYFFNIFDNEDVIFRCIILDKDELDFSRYFQNNLYKVYSSFSIVLLKLIIGKKPEELVILLCDDYFTPDGTELEDKIKKIINDHFQNFVIAGVCQINSKSSDLLQLTDLILGAILYDLKKQRGLIGKRNTYKRKFLNFLFQKLKIKRSFFINWLGIETKNYSSYRGKIKASIFDCKRSKVDKFIQTKKQAMTHNG